MSYQEPTQLLKETRLKDDGNSPAKRCESDTIERPYTGSAASFSVPRPRPPHSSSSSTSSATLSPSNSASQQDASPAVGRPDQLYLAQLKGLRLAVATEKKPNLVDVELPWRPSYLRRRILATFLCIFVALIVALEVLLGLSNRYDGLADGDTARRTIYVWTCLPVLALAVLAGMWTRVDYQAKAAAPWIRMSRGPAPAEKTLLLDYVSMSLSASIAKAVLNRDVVVACTSMVSLHLRMLFVVSTALLALGPVDVPPSSATGTIMLRGEKLLASALAAQLMAILLAISSVLTAVAMCFSPRKGFLPRDPNTIIDTAALIAHSRPLLQSLRGAGGGSDKVLRDRLKGSKYSIGVEAYERGPSSHRGYLKIFGEPNTMRHKHGYVAETGRSSYPINLHPAVRFASLLGLLAIILVLELSLHASQEMGGFKDVMDDTYSHFLWTAIPAVVLWLFSTYFASVDFTTRALAPYAALKDGSAFHNSVSLNYLDRTVSRSIYDAVRHRNFAVATAGIAGLVSSLFVVFAAALISEAAIPTGPAAPLTATRRLVQSTTSTRILQCLLSLTLLLSLASLLLNPAKHHRPHHPRASHSPLSIASAAALLADGNVFGLLGRDAEWARGTAPLRAFFMDGLHVAAGFAMGWAAADGSGRSGRRRRMGVEEEEEEEGGGGRREVGGGGGEGGGEGGEGDGGARMVFGVRAVRTGGWGGGEGVGLGLLARVGYTQRRFVRDWGWRT